MDLTNSLPNISLWCYSNHSSQPSSLRFRIIRWGVDGTPSFVRGIHGKLFALQLSEDISQYQAQYTLSMPKLSFGGSVARNGSRWNIRLRRFSKTNTSIGQQHQTSLANLILISSGITASLKYTGTYIFEWGEVDMSRPMMPLIDGTCFIWSPTWCRADWTPDATVHI